MWIWIDLECIVNVSEAGLCTWSSIDWVFGARTESSPQEDETRVFSCSIWVRSGRVFFSSVCAGFNCCFGNVSMPSINFLWVLSWSICSAEGRTFFSAVSTCFKLWSPSSSAMILLIFLEGSSLGDCAILRWFWCDWREIFTLTIDGSRLFCWGVWQWVGPLYEWGGLKGKT